MKNIGEENWGHLGKNKLKSSPFDGIELIPGLPFKWTGKISGAIEGGKNSTAFKMIEYIRNSPKKYPHVNRYSLLGPNSNTYVQWVLNAFPEVGLKLPFNAVGKRFV